VTELAREAGGDGVSLTNLTKKLGIDKSSTSHRVNDAIAKGYLIVAGMVTGRAKFSCACGTPRSARQAGDPQI
jgi:hypothetical protein